jgi:outer membrane protein assembly factor BamB
VSEGGRDSSTWREPAWNAARSAAQVGGAFAVLLACLLTWNHVRLTRVGLLESGELARLKARLAENPDDEVARDAIRLRDQRIRDEHFGRSTFARRGGILLATALIVMAGAMQASTALRRQAPRLSPASEINAELHRSAVIGRWSVALLGVGVCCVALTWASSAGGPVYARLGSTSEDSGADAAPVLPSPEEYARNWPRFRGPEGSGVCGFAGIPTDWDGPSGRGILWKTPVPMGGKGSPILWGGKVFLSGAEKRRGQIQGAVFCFDAESGKLLWESRPTIVGSAVGVPDIMDDTGYAAPTSATDGLRVYSMFANGDLACFDFEGKQVWAKNLGLPENMYGHSSSLATSGDRLLILFDQAMAEDGLSRLICLDGPTGKELWSTPRDLPNSWASPIVIRAAGRELLIACGNPWVTANDVTTGAEVWRADVLMGDIGPSPILAGGMVLAANDGAVLAAIRPDGEGNVTETHVAWTADDGMPDMVSPLSDGVRVWLVNSAGDLTCYSLADGSKLYEEYLELAFVASPSLVDGVIYLLSEQGVMHRIAADDDYRLLNTCELGERVYASPAFAEGRIYLRGHKNLYCIGAP